MSVNISTAFSAAFSNDSEIVVGWIPIFKQYKKYTPYKKLFSHIYLHPRKQNLIPRYKYNNLLCTFLKQFSTSTEQASCNYDNSSGPVSSFNILCFGQLYKLQ